VSRRAATKPRVWIVGDMDEYEPACAARGGGARLRGPRCRGSVHATREATRRVVANGVQIAGVDATRGRSSPLRDAADYARFFALAGTGSGRRLAAGATGGCHSAA
jgi:hypothetical protein